MVTNAASTERETSPCTLIYLPHEKHSSSDYFFLCRKICSMRFSLGSSFFVPSPRPTCLIASMAPLASRSTTMTRSSSPSDTSPPSDASSAISPRCVTYISPLFSSFLMDDSIPYRLALPLASWYVLSSLFREHSDTAHLLGPLLICRHYVQYPAALGRPFVSTSTNTNTSSSMLTSKYFL